MAEYRIAEQPLIINKADNVRMEVNPGDIILTEADGTISGCIEAELQDNIMRIDAEIVVRDAQIEADRLAAEQAAQENPPEEPPEGI